MTIVALLIALGAAALGYGVHTPDPLVGLLGIFLLSMGVSIRGKTR